MPASLELLFELKDLNETEYTALYKLCLMVMCADGRVFESEKIFLESLLNSISNEVLAEKVRAASKLAKIEVLNTLASGSEHEDGYIKQQCALLPADKSKLFVELITQAAIVDEDIGSTEHYLLERIVDAL